KQQRERQSFADHGRFSSGKTRTVAPGSRRFDGESVSLEALAGDPLPPGLRYLVGPAARFQAALDHAVGGLGVAVGRHGVGQLTAAEPVGRIAEHVAPRVLDGAPLLVVVLDLGLALRAVAGVPLGVVALGGVGSAAAGALIAAGQCQSGDHGGECPPHLAPSSAASMAFSASGALAASGPPPCAMSGRPPPPLPPSAATPAFTSSTALSFLAPVPWARSSVTPTTAEALPSSTPISATTPEPSFFLNSSAMPLRSLPGTPFSTRPIIFTPPTWRT